MTVPTGCTGTGNNIIFAWADMRDGGVSRIYYRRSTNGGTTWQGPASGKPLLFYVYSNDVLVIYTIEIAEIPSIRKKERTAFH